MNTPPPSTSSSNPSQPNALAVALCLIGTLALGATLRAWLGGSGWLPHDFRHLRHAHTHLGWYGAIFPLAFGVWRRRGWWTPGKRLMASYWLAVLVALIGFVRAGYGVDAIAGSTWVLGTWVAVALRNREQLSWRREDWLAMVPVMVVLTAMSIPPIAVTLRRDPGLSARWVQTFMTVMLLGVGVPTALQRGGLRAPPAGLWALGVVACALWVGVLPMVWLQPGMWLLGGLLLGAAWVSRAARRELRFGVAAVGGGLLAVAAGLLPFGAGVAVAGIHLAVLGPVLGGLYGPPRGAPWLAPLLLALLLTMCTGIVLTSLGVVVPVGGGAVWTGGQIAAVSGVGLAVGWAARVVVDLTRAPAQKA